MITELYQRTLKELTSSNRAWMDFLKTAAFQYKYPFSDQVLIHAQRPGAVACTELEVWNEKFGRWVNKGAHGIALIRDKGGRVALTHVFDVRDTHHRDELPFRLWEARSEMRRDIAEALENSFGHLPMKATIGDAAISACENICEDNLTDYLDNLMSSADGSLLDDYDEENMRVRLLPLLKYSTAYAVLTRLGYKADESLDVDNLAALREFNTPEVINVLGTATGDLSEICLREIERTVRAYEKNKIRTFAETENVRYNNPENNNTLGKGGQENEHGSNVSVQSTRGIDDSRSEAAHRDQLSSRQIRNDAARISQAASEGNVHDASHASEAERASARSGGIGERTDLDDYIPDGTEPWGDGADESDRPDEMGSDDERLESRGGGRSSEQPDLRISDEEDPYYYGGKGVDPQYLDTDISGELPMPDEDTMILALRYGDYLRKSKEEIVSFLRSEKDEQKKSAYVRNAYEMGLTGEFYRPGTKEHIGYHVEPSGLLIYEGSFTDRKTEVKFTWGLVVELIEALVKDKNYLDEPKEDKQLSLLDMEENVVESAYEPPSKVEKPLAFSQATIDDFLRVGGCTKNSPERIYGYYRRASDKEENIRFLKNEYETDNVGLIIDGRKMAASWNEDGMIIAEGTKVDGAWKSITLTWDEIEKRTRELIELGQYLPQHQAEQADEIFEKFVADRLASLYHGGSFANIPEEHLSVSGFMSYPKYVEAFQDILQDPVKAAALYDELKENEKLLEKYPPRTRYREGWLPDFVGFLTKQFTKEPIAFKAADPYILPREKYVSEERIRNTLVKGGNVYEGKYRIYSFFLNNKDAQARIDFLKDEYGTGGSSSDRNDESHDGKGLIIAYGSMLEKNKLLLKWAEVAKRIDALIREDKYLNEKEIAGLDAYEKKQVAHAIESFYRDRTADVPRPFKQEDKDRLYDEGKDILLQLEDSNRVVEIYDMMREVFETEMPGSRNYEYHKNCLETVKQYADGTYNLFPNSHFRKKAKPKAEEAGEVTAREETTEEEPAAEIVDIDLSQSGYDIQLGSWIYIGTGEVMLQSVTDKGVELYDGTMFPLEMPYEVFLERLRENPLNDHLKKSVDLEPKTAYKDAFYVYPENDMVVWIYFNPDANAGGQYVSNYLKFDDIASAMENRDDADDFFDALSEYAEVELTDAGTPNFAIVDKDFKTKAPTLTDCTEATMQALIEFYEKNKANEKLLDEAIDCINVYYEKEFHGSAGDFENLYKIPLARTTIGEDEKHTISVCVDLVNLDLISDIDGIEVERLHYDSLRKLIDTELKNLDFDSLVYLDDPDERIKYAEGVIADREAEKANDAHEREFGADGTRVFGEPEAEEESLTFDMEAQLDKFVPVVSEAISKDTAYCNACGHSDYENAVMEGNAAIRRAVLNLKDMELLKLFLDNIEFRHELYPRVIANTYERLHEMYRPMNQDDVDRATAQMIAEKNYVPGIEKLSPFEQLERLKGAHPDAIAAVRVGDFYEFFDEDAEKVAGVLELTMTSRSFPDGTRHPMCGFPFHKENDFFEKLNDKGYNVAQCDGDGDPVILNVPKRVQQEQELKALGRVMRACRIDDIAFYYENDVFTATDGENTWTRAEFYKFLRDEVLDLDEDDNTPDFLFVPDDVLHPILEYIHEEELKEVMTDEELDELPVSTVIDGRVETFRDAEAMLDALDSAIPVMQEPPKPKPKAAGQVFHPEVDFDDRIDHKLRAEDLPVRVPSDKYERNIRAIRLLRQLEDENRLATASEQKLLADYSGWGGLADRFDENHSDYEELKSILSPEEYTAARKSTLTAFYTPPVVIEAMYKALENMGFSRGNILEPSCGVGNFIGFLPESMSDSKVYGVELDSLSGRMAQQLYQKQNITVGGFEETLFPDSFFDVAIGNVPFGQFKVVDKKYDKYNFLIHDYFFAKALDKVRPGGVVAFITSKGTLDKENPAVRKYIAERAELLGAIRLPDNAFRSAGTDVVSDIIFLQKRDRVIETEPDWVHLGKDENGIVMNQYFVDNPDMVLGDIVMRSGPFGPEPTCRAYEGQDLGELLSDAISNIHAEITEVESADLEEDTDFIPADPNVKNFSYTLVDGKVYYRQNSIMNRVETTVTGENRIKGMIAIRDTVRDLIDAQLEDYPDSVITELQSKLNTQYDEFIGKYGLINSRGNESVFSDDSSYFLLSSLEILNEEKELERKADMFTKRTIKPYVKIDRVDTASEALAVSLSERAAVDMEYMSELTGKTEDEIYDELKGVIFLNPLESAMMNQPKYLTADDYLSGNVREKLARAKRMVASGFPEYAVNVEALEAIQPQDLTAPEIGIKLGSTWVPDDIVQDFVFGLLGTPSWARWNMSIKYIPQTAQWVITNKSHDKTNVKANTVYGTSRVNAYEIIEDTLNLKDVRVFDYVDDGSGKPKPVLNKHETTIAQGKQEEIKRAFEDWVWQDPERREELCKLYNEKFNSIRPREYDGSHIKYYGMNPEIQLRKHQTDAVARIMYGGNTLLAHVVGAGKTFTMVAAAQEMKRLGLCHKSMFVVPNHLIEQWASEYLQLYPSANILVATKKDFETKNRKKFCARIATGDYDAVIIGHSQFEKIPVSIERQQRTLEAEIKELTNSIAELKYQRGERVTVKQLEKSKKSLETKLKKLNDQSRKDDVVNFEELGIDRLFVDEAHFYKNLFSYTKMRNVAGIAQTEAQKSSDLYMKCRYLDEVTGGKGVIFATGTPISNSMVELYTMQRYLQYDELKCRGLSAFDSWASTFGETVTAIELAPDGSGYRAKTRFAKFYNIPELMAMFKQVADVQTADMLNLPVPKANYQIVKVAATETQKKMVESFAERAEKIHNKMVSSNVDNMLMVTSDGRKAALDQRLINPMLPDEEGSKVNACVRNVFDTWEQNKDKRLTQMVFCDLSTPKGDGKFNVYDDMRDKLVAMGIPREEIAFIHTADTDAKKKELFAKVRAGQVRILMGSTFKMGAGTNVQKLLKRLHDLDCPWRPSDLEQRAGRIVRQGNTNEEVDISRYITEGTFDAYMYQLLESKQKFISQIMTSKSPVRSAEDVDETALSYAEIKALASGNPKIIEKMQLDADVAKLRLQRADHNSQKFKLEDRLLKHFPRDIKDVEARISGLEADIETAKANTHRDEKSFSGVKIMGTDFTEKAEAGRQILEICKRISNPEPRPLGEYRGFKTEIGFDTMQKQYFIILVGKLRHTVLLGDDANGIFTRLDNKIEGMELRLRNCREELRNLHEQVENAKAELLKPFPREAELNEKQARLDILNSELNMDKKENELADEAPEPNGESGKANPPSECEVDEEIEERSDSDRDER